MKGVTRSVVVPFDYSNIPDGQGYYKYTGAAQGNWKYQNANGVNEALAEIARKEEVAAPGVLAARQQAYDRIVEADAGARDAEELARSQAAAARAQAASAPRPPATQAKKWGLSWGGRRSSKKGKKSKTRKYRKKATRRRR
jgi:hypothetical protein